MLLVAFLVMKNDLLRAILSMPTQEINPRQQIAELQPKKAEVT